MQQETLTAPTRVEDGRLALAVFELSTHFAFAVNPVRRRGRAHRLQYQILVDRRQLRAVRSAAMKKYREK